jgi:hypothetical protein
VREPPRDDAGPVERRVTTVVTSALGLLLVAALLGGCREPRLGHLRDDPMATVGIPHTRQVDGSERGADRDGGLLGKPVQARIYRELRLDRRSDGPDALRAAVGAAERAGWRDGRWIEPGRSYLAERDIEGVRCTLSLILSRKEGVERRLYPHASLLVYLTASNNGPD